MPPTGDGQELLVLVGPPAQPLAPEAGHLCIQTPYFLLNRLHFGSKPLLRILLICFDLLHFGLLLTGDLGLGNDAGHLLVEARNPLDRISASFAISELLPVELAIIRSEKGKPPGIGSETPPLRPDSGTGRPSRSSAWPAGPCFAEPHLESFPRLVTGTQAGRVADQVEVVPDLVAGPEDLQAQFLGLELEVDLEVLESSLLSGLPSRKRSAFKSEALQNLRHLK